MQNIGVLIGSLSKQSYSRKVANYFTSLPSDMHFIEINYSKMPFYNPDYEHQNTPVEWQALRKAVDSVDALLIVTQEYNYSLPGGLKNALDILSVPSPDQHLMGKPVLAITDSAGEKGGIIANAHLHQVLRYLGMRVMNCTIAIGDVQTVFKDGVNHDHHLDQQLRQDMQRFSTFIRESQVSHEACINLQHRFNYRPGKLTLLNADNQEIAAIILSNDSDNVINIDEVLVPKEFQGQGLASEVMTTLMWLVEGADYRVNARCPFAQKYLEVHAQFNNLLAN